MNQINVYSFYFNRSKRLKNQNSILFKEKRKIIQYVFTVKSSNFIHFHEQSALKVH